MTGMDSYSYGARGLPWPASSGWRTRKAAGVSSESKGPQTRSSDVQGEDIDGPAQEEKANSSFLCLFVLFGPSVDWMVATHIGEVGCSSPSLLIEMLMSFWKHPERHTQKEYFISYSSIP